MNKRATSVWVLVSLLLLGVAVGCTSAKTPSNKAGDAITKAAPIVLTIGHVLKTTDGYQVAAEKFKEIVEAKTQGQIQVNIVPEGKLGPENQMLSKTLSGDIDGAIITHGSVSSYVSEFVFLDVPFLIRSIEHAHRLLDGEIGRTLEQKLREAGFYPIGITDFGFRHLTNNLRPVKVPRDAQGLQIRVLPNAPYQTTWELLTGKAPMVLTWPAVIEALKAKTIDGQENPVSLLVSYKIWELQKYASKTGHIFAVAPFLMNEKRMKSLTQEQQQIILDAGKEAVKTSRIFLTDSEAKGWDILKQNGMTVVEDVDREAFRKEVWDKMIGLYGKSFPQAWLDQALK